MTGEQITTALLLSLKVAIPATIVVALLGGALGRYLAGRTGPWPDVVDAVASLPLFLPPTVLGYYLTILLGRNGPIGSLLAPLGIELTFSWVGGAIAGVIVAFPLMVRSARIAFEGIDPELERAAELDGASPFDRWRSVILPLARAGLAGGVMLSFGRAIGEFGATLMISGNIPGETQTMPLAIYEAFTLGEDGAATTMSLILTGVSVVVVLVGLRLGRSRGE